MSTSKPYAATVFPWLRANLGKNCLGVLTGTDARALQAAVQIAELYAYDRRPQVAVAFGTVVKSMQPQARELAYHAIAHPRDWTDRETMWVEAGLDKIPNSRRCKFES
ncbi:MAG TPA: hypothetical protein VH413_16085 [Verrucomicrobiae bacterium]|jgi:hypothetical protein|nr:hypothetical protein [Verrucomicrobiae bacterium]